MKFKENLNTTATHPASCQEYFDRGTRIDGTYKIKPSLMYHSFEVNCEFQESSEKGITIVKPLNWQSQGKVFPSSNSHRCKGANCFTDDVKYSAIELTKTANLLYKI